MSLEAERGRVDRREGLATLCVTVERQHVEGQLQETTEFSKFRRAKNHEY